MQDIVKAKVLIELLDDRKYSVLSSFSSEELNALNAVDLVALNTLTDTDINSVVGDFLSTVQQHQASMPEAQEAMAVTSVDPIVSESSQVVLEPVVANTLAPNPVVMQTTVESDALRSKLAEQPLQILAFLLTSLDEDKAQLVRSKLTPEQLNTIAVLDIDQSPISQQVIQVIIDDLNL
jgi:flagellar motor switch protein FliG